jgi:hypothetical protein
MKFRPLVPNVGRNEQGLLKAFRAHREAIGALAVGKYDRGFADDGKTVKICERTCRRKTAADRRAR